MANYTLNQNQFTQQPTIGMLTFDPQPDTIPCQLNPSSTSPSASFVAGAAVKLIGFANAGQVIVDTTLSASDGPVYGVIAFSKQKNTYVPGDQLNVAARGNVVFLESGAAVTRGNFVSVTNPAVTTNDPTVSPDTTAGDYVVGAALGQVGASGQMVRIQINPGFNVTISASTQVVVTP